MQFPLALLFLVITLCLPGCSTQNRNVQRDFDASFNFSRVKTFDFAGGTLETEAARKTAERIRLDELLAGEIRKSLESKGFRQSTSQPDVKVAYSFGEWALDSHQKPNGGYGAVGIMFPGAHGSLLPEGSDGRVPPPSEDPYTSKYEEARLEILFVDSATGKIIWNGGIRDKSDFGYFRSSQSAQIEKAVTSILEGFPPKAGSPP